MCNPLGGTFGGTLGANGERETLADWQADYVRFFDACSRGHWAKAAGRTATLHMVTRLGSHRAICRINVSLTRTLLGYFMGYETARESKRKARQCCTSCIFTDLVELMRFELTTSAVRLQRSPI